MHRADRLLPPRPTSGRFRMTSGAGHCGPVRQSEVRDRKQKAKDRREAGRWAARTRTDGGGADKGRCVVYGERSGAGPRCLGGESASREGRGRVRERAEEEVSWRRAVELLLAGSLLGNSWRTRRAAAAGWRRMKSSRAASRRPTSSRTWDSVSMCILSCSRPSVAHALAPALPARSLGLVSREHGAAAAAFGGASAAPSGKAGSGSEGRSPPEEERRRGVRECGLGEAALCNLFGAVRGGGGGWECRRGESGLGRTAGKERLRGILLRAPGSPPVLMAPVGASGAQWRSFCSRRGLVGVRARVSTASAADAGKAAWVPWVRVIAVSE